MPYDLLLTVAEARLASVRCKASSVGVFAVGWNAIRHIDLTSRSRYTGDSDSSTNELTRGLVKTASIRSKMASFPLPNSVYAD